MKNVSLVLVLFSLFSNPSKCAYQPYKYTDPDYGASVYHLKLLVLEELNLLPSILITLEHETCKKGYAELKEYLEDFTAANMGHLSENGISLGQFVSLLRLDYINTENFADDVVKHPMKSFRTIRRFVKLISKIPNIACSNHKELLTSFHRTKHRIKFPKESDLESSMLNILRLCKIFTLSVANMLEGRLDDLETGSGLTLQQLTEMAVYAGTLGMYTHAIDMFDEVLRICDLHKTSENCSGINLELIQSKLNAAVEEHDNLILANEFDATDLNVIPPDSSPFIFNGPLENVMSKKFINRQPSDVGKLLDTHLESLLNVYGRGKREVHFAISPVLYERLCRGEFRQESFNVSLKCFYSRKTHPTHVLAPLKVETHSENPHIIQIYDFLNEMEINKLKSEVQRDLRQSRTTTTTGDELGQTSRFRTSANAWIEDNEDENFKYLNKRIAHITGLNVTGYTSSEIVQIAAYNAGGHYTPHSDALFEDLVIQNPNLPATEFERGDRMMTFMVYLSDVEKGGCTGFSVLKTLVCPVKGSAVIWHNLNSDGSINYEMIHGGCPVLFGTKWIANKWIRSNDQMFLKKCPANREAWKIFREL